MPNKMLTGAQRKKTLDSMGTIELLPLSESFWKASVASLAAEQWETREYKPEDGNCPKPF